MNKLPDVFYPLSPFVPPVDLSTSQEIMSHIASGIHPATAIAYSLIMAANKVLPTLRQNAAWIVESIGASIADQNKYYLGLVDVPYLIYGASLVPELGFEATVEELMLSGESFEVAEHNRYLAATLPYASKLYKSVLPNPLMTADPIHRHCKTWPYSKSVWYAAGLDTSQRLYHEYAKLVTIV